MNLSRLDHFGVTTRTSIVVASVAKQSRVPRVALDCFAALAMTGVAVTGRGA